MLWYRRAIQVTNRKKKPLEKLNNETVQFEGFKTLLSYCCRALGISLADKNVGCKSLLRNNHLVVK